jgi:hypothetical protein
MISKNTLDKKTTFCYSLLCITNPIPAYSPFPRFVRVSLLPDVSTFRRANVQTIFVLSPLLCFHTVTNCPPLTGEKQPLCFPALMNCKFRKPFVLIFMHRMGGVPPPAAFQISPFNIRHLPLNLLESALPRPPSRNSFIIRTYETLSDVWQTKDL